MIEIRIMRTLKLTSLMYSAQFFKAIVNSLVSNVTNLIYFIFLGIFVYYIMNNFYLFQIEII